MRVMTWRALSISPRLTHDTRVRNAFDDVASTIHHFLPSSREITATANAITTPSSALPPTTHGTASAWQEGH